MFYLTVHKPLLLTTVVSLHHTYPPNFINKVTDCYRHFISSCSRLSVVTVPLIKQHPLTLVYHPGYSVGVVFVKLKFLKLQVSVTLQIAGVLCKTVTTHLLKDALALNLSHYLQ